MKRLLELNLIREKIDKIEKNKKYSKYFMGIYIITFTVFLVLIVNLFYEYKNYSRDTKLTKAYQLEIEQKKNQPQIKILNDEWNGYYADLKKIKDIFVDRKTSWALKFQELSTIMPGEMFIDNLSADNTNITLNAIINSEGKQGLDIANNFIKAIEKNGHFGKNAKILSQDRVVQDKKDVELFKISIAL